MLRTGWHMIFGCLFPPEVLFRVKNIWYLPHSVNILLRTYKFTEQHFEGSSFCIRSHQAHHWHEDMKYQVLGYTNRSLYLHSCWLLLSKLSTHWVFYTYVVFNTEAWTVEVKWSEVSRVQCPTKHIIGHFGDGFCGSNDPTNSVKALKEVVFLRIGFNPTRSTSPCYKPKHEHAHNTQ